MNEADHCATVRSRLLTKIAPNQLQLQIKKFIVFNFPIEIDSVLNIDLVQTVTLELALVLTVPYASISLSIHLFNLSSCQLLPDTGTDRARGVVAIGQNDINDSFVSNRIYSLLQILVSKIRICPTVIQNQNADQ